MKKRDIVFIIIGMVVVTALVTIGIKHISNLETFELAIPKKDDVVKIRITQNEKQSEVEDGYIEAVLSVFDNIDKITHEESIQDYPTNVDNVIKIDFYVYDKSSASYIVESEDFYYNSISTMYVYEKDSNYYLEQPYNGIYKMTVDDYNNLKSLLIQEPLKNEVLDKLNNTKKIVVKNQNETEIINTITKGSEIKNFLSVISNTKVWTGAYNEPANSYNIYLLDSEDKKIAKVVFDPQLSLEIDSKTYSLINFNREDLIKLIEN